MLNDQLLLVKVNIVGKRKYNDMSVVNCLSTAGIHLNMVN